MNPGLKVLRGLNFKYLKSVLQKKVLLSLELDLMIDF